MTPLARARAKYVELVHTMRFVLRQPGQIDRLRLYSLQGQINELRKQHPELAGTVPADVKEDKNQHARG